MTCRSAAGISLAAAAAGLLAAHGRVTAQEAAPSAPAAAAVYYVDFDARADTNDGLAPASGK